LKDKVKNINRKQKKNIKEKENDSIPYGKGISLWTSDGVTALDSFLPIWIGTCVAASTNIYFSRGKKVWRKGDGPGEVKLGIGSAV
jgi:hypothetical protein